MDFLAALKKAGFKAVERTQETGFNSSPKAKGILIHARKPMEQIATLHKDEEAKDQLGKSRRSML